MTRATTLTSVAALVTAIAAAGGVYAGHGSASAVSTPTYTLRAVGDSARPEADTQRDGDRRPALTLALSGVKPGAQVAELIPGGGFFTRLSSAVVGPKGKGYALGPRARPHW